MKMGVFSTVEPVLRSQRSSAPRLLRLARQQRPRNAKHFDFFAAAIPDDDKADPWYPKSPVAGRMQAEGEAAGDRSLAARSEQSESC
jgi:hypothetical protein